MKPIIHNISSDDPALLHSKLLATSKLIFAYIDEHGSIGLTKTKAFNRKFVAWAADNIDWPQYSAKKLYRVNKVLNEPDIYPIWVLHDLFIILKMGRHYKNEFRLSKKGKTLSADTGQLYAALAECLLYEYNLANLDRFDEGIPHSWDVFLNVLNVEAHEGVTRQHLMKTFYGYETKPEGIDREYFVYSMFLNTRVLMPLVWLGFLEEQKIEDDGFPESRYSKTPLWHKAFRLDTNDMLIKVVP